MGFTWIFGYIAAFTDVEALWYIYIILNSLQGVFIFIAFIFNRRIGLLWSEKLKLSGFVERESKKSTSNVKSRQKSSSGTGSTNTTSLNNCSRNPDIEDADSKQALRVEKSV